MIKIRKGFTVRKILDEHIVVGIGSDAYMPNCLMSLTGTAFFLWNRMTEGIEKEDLLRALLEEYDVDEAAARADLEVFLSELRAKNLIEEA